MDADQLMLVFTNATAGNEAECSTWYDEVHIADVLTVPGVVAAQRYALADMDIPEANGLPIPPPPGQKFLAIYELDRDANVVMAEFVRRTVSGEMALNPTLDLTTVSIHAWQPLGPRRLTKAE